MGQGSLLVLCIYHRTSRTHIAIIPLWTNALESPQPVLEISTQKYRSAVNFITTQLYRPSGDCIKKKLNRNWYLKVVD